MDIIDTQEMLERLCVTNSQRRAYRLKQVLTELGYQWHLQRGQIRDASVENIIVSLRPQPMRLVLGAHYDSYIGSTGANDNMSGVCALIKLLPALRDEAISADVVFFGKEERGLLGSELYVSRTQVRRISTMINLDTVGYGDQIVLSSEGGANAVLSKLYDGETMARYGVIKVPRVPLTDDYSFEAAGIPSAAIQVYPRQDLEALHAYAAEKADRRDAPFDLRRFVLGQTMHGGKLDTVENVDTRLIERVADYLREALCASSNLGDQSENT